MVIYHQPSHIYLLRLYSLQDARNKQLEIHKNAVVVLIRCHIPAPCSGRTGWINRPSASDSAVRLRTGTRRFAEYDIQWLPSC
jgi:hypothetical protein